MYTYHFSQFLINQFKIWCIYFTKITKEKHLGFIDKVRFLKKRAVKIFIILNRSTVDDFEVKYNQFQKRFYL